MTTEEARQILAGTAQGDAAQANQVYYDYQRASPGAEAGRRKADQLAIQAGNRPAASAPAAANVDGKSPLGGSVAAQGAPAASGRFYGGNTQFAGFTAPTEQELATYGYNPETAAGVYSLLGSGTSPYNIRELDPWTGSQHWEYGLPGGAEAGQPDQPNLWRQPYSPEGYGAEPPQWQGPGPQPTTTPNFDLGAYGGPGGGGGQPGQGAGAGAGQGAGAGAGQGGPYDFPRRTNQGGFDFWNLFGGRPPGISRP